MIVSWRRSASGALPVERFGSTECSVVSRNVRNAAIEENTTMADGRHTELPKVLGGQLGQDCLVDRVFPECLLIAVQAEAAQPGTDIHGIHTPSALIHWLSPRQVGRYGSRAPSVESLADQTVARDEVASLPYHIGRNTFFLLVGAPKSVDEPRASLRERLSLTIPTIALIHETDHPVSLAARLRRISFLENME
jgi:hypothetical protein